MSVKRKVTLITTTVKVHGIDNPEVFSDATADGDGAKAWNLATNNHDIKVGNVFVPFHAIEKVSKTEKTSETEVSDPFCE